MTDDPLQARLQVEFGKRLQRTRQAKGRMQTGLAQHLGVSRTSVSNLERGAHRVFLDTVYKAARYLDVDVSELLPELRDVYDSSTVSSPADEPLDEDVQRELARVVRQVSRSEGGSPPRPGE